MTHVGVTAVALTGSTTSKRRKLHTAVVRGIRTVLSDMEDPRDKETKKVENTHLLSATRQDAHGEEIWNRCQLTMAAGLKYCCPPDTSSEP